MGDESTGFFESVGEAWDEGTTYLATHTAAEVGHDVDVAGSAAYELARETLAPMAPAADVVDAAYQSLAYPDINTDEVGPQTQEF